MILAVIGIIHLWITCVALACAIKFKEKDWPAFALLTLIPILGPTLIVLVYVTQAMKK